MEERYTDRQILLIMREVDAINYERLGLKKAGVSIIEIDNLNDFPLAKKIDQQKIKENSILVLDPMSVYRYFDVSDASKNIHMSYFQQCSAIVALLGAKKFLVSSVSCLDEKGHVQFSLDSNVLERGGSMAANMEEAMNAKQMFSICDSWKNSPFNLSGARELQAKYDLCSDPTLTTLFDAIERGAKPEKKEYVLSLSKKLSRTLQIAATVMPYAGIDIKAAVKNDKEWNYTYELKVEIQF